MHSANSQRQNDNAIGPTSAAAARPMTLLPAHNSIVSGSKR